MRGLDHVWDAIADKAVEHWFVAETYDSRTPVASLLVCGHRIAWESLQASFDRGSPPAVAAAYYRRSIVRNNSLIATISWSPFPTPSGFHRFLNIKSAPHAGGNSPVQSPCT